MHTTSTADPVGGGLTAAKAPLPKQASSSLGRKNDIDTAALPKLDPAKYHLSRTTRFVPTDPAPLISLPPYFSGWDDLASRLPTLLRSESGKALRDGVRGLPLLDAARLEDLGQLRRAYVVLGYLVHGVAWSGAGADGEVEVRIPPQLAQPYFEVCERLGMQGSETLAYAGLCSWNWGFIDDSGREGDGDGDDGKWEWRNLKCLVSFSGTRDEEVFYLVPVLVEREAGAVLEGLCEVLDLIQDDDNLRGGRNEQGRKEVVEKAKLVLHQLKDRLEKMQTLMKHLHEECDPTIFWTKVRPYFAGGKGGPGWVFELADGTEARRWCVGGSAAQSATFPFLDAALGIKHAKLGGEKSVFEEMREYMPVEQTDFLAEVEVRGNIAQFVNERQDERELTDVYNDVLQEMAKWRSKHIAAVTTHIVNQARKEKKEAVPAEEITDGLSVKDESDLKGTGGSALIPFLKGARKDTEQAKI